MSDFEKCFDERTVDGICAVVFWSAKDDFDEAIKEKYISIYLYDAPFSKTKCWFCIKKENVPPRGKIIFKVPESMMGRIIGRGGINIKKIAKALGGRYVTVQKV